MFGNAHLQLHRERFDRNCGPFRPLSARQTPTRPAGALFVADRCPSTGIRINGVPYVGFELHLAVQTRNVRWTDGIERTSRTACARPALCPRPALCGGPFGRRGEWPEDLTPLWMLAVLIC